MNHIVFAFYIHNKYKSYLKSVFHKQNQDTLIYRIHAHSRKIIKSKHLKILMKFKEYDATSVVKTLTGNRTVTYVLVNNIQTMSKHNFYTAVIQ